MSEVKVYLWVDGQGWQLFPLSAIEEFTKRKIIIGNNSIIGNNVKVKCLSFSGTRNHVSYWGEDAIQIGCKKYTISDWLANYKEVGGQQQYTSKEIEEYGEYINIISAYHNAQKS